MSILNDAIEEFINEDDNGKSKLVYSYFGLAVYFSQVIEETFLLMLWFNQAHKRPIINSQKLYKKILQIEESKKTMGVFINEIKQTYNLSEKLVNDLDIILSKRNYLVHKYFKENIQKFYSDEGKIEMIKYFCEFTDSVMLVDNNLNIHYKEFLNKIGLNQEKINELVEEFKLEGRNLYK